MTFDARYKYPKPFKDALAICTESNPDCAVLQEDSRLCKQQCELRRLLAQHTIGAGHSLKPNEVVTKDGVVVHYFEK